MERFIEKVGQIGSISMLKLFVLEKVNKEQAFQITMHEKDYLEEFKTFIQEYLDLRLGCISFKGHKVIITFNPDDKKEITKLVWVKKENN
ncbi:hypothetical protein HZI73_26385 (plasmid) [Vallitalea pronyensis]|uniref:Uncharacterized protein n=1 Tax=Vallitalea pronyensis TaxID=1348613 RepID=A0A8J8MQP6_9FIRM|nr:hypothetical protein [Vallitalea pronyensis]QUI25944.1 hypothetical protein HZI73_26385 [Vallitalea pronyensis]